LQDIALTRSPALRPPTVLGLDPHIPWTDASQLGHTMLRPLHSARVAYAAAAAVNLPHTATNHVTL